MKVLVLAVFSALLTVNALSRDFEAHRGNYPSAPPPAKPTQSLESVGDGCETCPWNRTVNGQYPNPFNAPETFKPIHRGEYFDVYGHWIENHYSEVYWTAQPAVPLPADIVSRFSGRAISFTGFEVDVVSGGEDNEAEWSIPEFQVYNHHFCATIRGSPAKMTFVGSRGQDSLLKGMDGDRSRRRAFEVHPPEWEPRDVPSMEPITSTIPTAQNFWQGNGGEHRKSFKHLPAGTGQLVESPEEFILQPMLINTNFPATPGQSPREAFHSAPLPSSSLSPKGANYSGLMECPCTTRTKRIITGYQTQGQGTCSSTGGGAGVTTAEECFKAAAQLLTGITSNVSTSSTTAPPGCFLVSSSGGTAAHFNSNAASTAHCGAQPGAPVRSLGSAHSTSGDLSLHLELDSASGNATITLQGPAGVWFGVGFNASAMADQPYTITVDGTGSVVEHKLGNHMSGVVLPPTVQVLSHTVGPAAAPAPVQMNHRGSAVGKDVAADEWRECVSACRAVRGCVAWTFFPRGFSTPYNLDDGFCRLRANKGDVGSGKGASSGGAAGFTSEGWKDGVWSGEVPQDAKQVRTVVLTRALTGAGDNYYTFDPSVAAIPFIEAVGTTPAFQYHGPSRGGGALVMVQEGAPVCVCRSQKMGGSINGIPWADNCLAYPATTIARDHNPSCSIETYMGGMICCHHGVSLLDAEQEIPASTFRYRMKFRFYFEDPTEVAKSGTIGSQMYPGLDYQNAFFMFRETEQSHGEYDVPRCAAGLPAHECVHQIEGHFQVKDAMHECVGRADVWCSSVPINHSYPLSNHVALVHISPHCHGPACISMRMINADTNQTICYTEPHYGTGDASMDEAGYASGIPPCLWGTAAEGLPAPPVLSLDTNITVIKRVNSTNAHRGVMAHWQMRAVWAADPASDHHAADAADYNM